MNGQCELNEEDAIAVSFNTYDHPFICHSFCHHSLYALWAVFGGKYAVCAGQHKTCWYDNKQRPNDDVMMIIIIYSYSNDAHWLSEW